MTYVSKTLDTLYELNSLVGDYSLSLATFGETNTLPENASVVFHEVGARITALFFTTLTLLLVPFFIIPDMFCLNLRIICERDLLSPAIFKVNVAFCKAVTLGLAAPFLAVISPQYIYKAHAAHLVLRRYIAEIFTQIPENVQALARKLDVDLTRLNHANAALANWREELIEHLATTLPTIERYQFEGAENPNFLTFNFLLYREAFRLLLRAHFPEADVQRVMPRIAQRQLRPYQANILQTEQHSGLFGQVFAFTDWIFDARSLRHAETQRQFRLIIKRALKETRAELVDTSKYDKLKLEVEKIKMSKKPELQALEIEQLLKRHFIFSCGAESPEAAVQRELERISSVKYEIQQLKMKNKKIQDKELHEFLASKGIILRKESIAQAMKRTGADLEAARLKVLQMRSKVSTEAQITALEAPRAAIAKKIHAFEEIKSVVEQMQKSATSEEQVRAFLATKSIIQKMETPEQTCERVLDDYQGAKVEVQRLVQVKTKAAEIVAYLKTKSIVQLPPQTAVEAIEKAKTARTFTVGEIATMDVAPYAAMFDRAIFRIVEMATLEYTNEGNETLVLVQHPDDQPEDLKLSKENNIFELFEALSSIHEKTSNITTEKMEILRWLLAHKDLEPTQIFDTTEKNVPPSTGIRPSVVIKGAKLIKLAYNKIVEVRQNLIDRRLRAEGGWGNDFTQAFQESNAAS